MFAALAAVALLAALSSLHCAAMCGPLASCASDGQPRRALQYHLGRLLGYAMLGAIAGGLGALLPTSIAPWAAAVAAWTAAVVLIFSAVRVWSRGRPPLIQIGRTESATRSRRAVALIARLIARHPGLSGTLTALLPCGVLWAAIAISIISGSAIAGAVTMAVFAVLSGVAVTVATILLALVKRGVGPKPLAAIFALSALAFLILPLPRLASETASEGNADVLVCPLHPGMKR